MSRNNTFTIHTSQFNLTCETLAARRNLCCKA